MIRCTATKPSTIFLAKPAATPRSRAMAEHCKFPPLTTACSSTCNPLVAGAEENVSGGRWLRPALDGLCHGEGRSAAAALLLLATLFHLIAGERLWSPVRNLVFDAYQRVLPRSVSRFPAVIIDIDERSLSAVGRWPWPRTRLSELIEATRALGALAVGVDIIMPEADDLSP